MTNAKILVNKIIYPILSLPNILTKLHVQKDFMKRTRSLARVNSKNRCKTTSLSGRFWFNSEDEVDEPGAAKKHGGPLKIRKVFASFFSLITTNTR
jgi:hypothetical protein